LKVGVGLPSTISGRDPALIAHWAKRADELPFSCLGAHDRLKWDGYEPMLALAVAAGATGRIKLAALAVIAPLRSSALLAKQASSLQAMSGGRFTLGVGIGPRRDDYELADVHYSGRGQLLDQVLAEARDFWDDGMQPRPELLLAGLGDLALSRMARYADGYVHGGGPPRAFANAAERARAAWSDLGRPGHPRIVGTGYFALGPDADRGLDEARAYYGFLGVFAERIAAGVLTSPAAVVEFLSGYQEAGCDEVVLFPTLADLEQLDRLTEAFA
jgi:alkanesulfonate monooxygenase SsuD/methylene tetrahydromethanopterin reductase-like flavin-dependent oxidoreductase (luciferase family)